MLATMLVLGALFNRIQQISSHVDGPAQVAAISEPVYWT